jgi:hypothetical protein
VQPADKASGWPDAGGLFGQDEERRLEGIFGIVPVPQHMLANAQDHRPVAGDQCLKCRRITVGEEAG